MKKKYLVLDESTLGQPKLVEKDKTKKAEKNGLSQLAGSTGIGLSIALPIVGGALLGSFLDKTFSTAPRLTLILIVVGIILGMSNLYLFLRKTED